MIRVAINGYGNLGRGAEQAITKNKDMELVVVFTRRDPASVTTQGAPVAHVDDMAAWTDKVDVCLNCGGSATDLIEQTPATAALFNTVDSFDTHARIPEHFAAVDAAAKAAGKVALISAGWDPGLFSMLRVLGEAVLPDGATTTFWGPGVSQGHSDALRRIDGVVDAKQYTRPVEATVAAVKAGDDVELTTRSMHTRDCYVVAEEGADLARIEREIVVRLSSCLGVARIVAQTELLVIGARRRSPVGKLFMGSVTQSIILHADVPVLVVKAPAAEK